MATWKVPIGSVYRQVPRHVRMLNLLLNVPIDKARDAYGCKFPACWLNLAEVHNSAKFQDFGTEPEFRYLAISSLKYSRNLEFSASSRFDSIYIQILYKSINSVHACMAMHACMHAWLERTNCSFHGTI